MAGSCQCVPVCYFSTCIDYHREIEMPETAMNNMATVTQELCFHDDLDDGVYKAKEDIAHLYE